MAQATATQIYEHNGKKYRLADHRDIGKNVWVSDGGFQDAVVRDPYIAELQEYHPEAVRYKYKTRVSWDFAFVELEEPVPAVVPFNGTLEVGQWYETNNGQRLYCNSRTHHDIYPMVMVQEDGCVETYMEKGLWIEDYDMDDDCSIALQLVGCTGFDWTKPVPPAVVAEPNFEASWLNTMCETIHSKQKATGWWDAADSPLVVPTKLALIVSECTEALEGHRRDAMDDKLTHRKALDTELADVFIRLCDLAGFLKVPLGTIVAEKEAYNASRADHKPENRKAVGGKRY